MANCGDVPSRWSDNPRVQAYVGAIDDRAGFEFTTEVSPDPDAAPGHASWSRGRPGVRAWTDIEGVQWAAIPVAVTTVNWKERP